MTKLHYGVTERVMSRVVPSEKVPVAVNCWVDPTDRIGLSGVTVMEVGCAIPFPPPQVFKDSARDPRTNNAKTNLIFFTGLT